MLEMYRGMVNSPETTITNDINAEDTIIYVLDETKVPEELPNLMTLGTGTSAETVKVLEVNGNALTVERGFQGVARRWNSGTVIARNFTEYDYNALMENIKTLKENTDTNAQELAAHKADSTHLNIKPCIKKLDTIISAGTSSDWDEAIREIGNVLYDPDDVNKPYKLVYSGYNPPYAGNNVYVGYAYSVDCKTWVKGGKLLERASEDPYLVKHNGMYYLYVEDKEVVPFRNIRLFTSTDFNNWTDRGVVLDIGDGWESQDVSSPTVFIDDDIWYLLYEGRSIGQEGAIGLATSTDGIEWTKDSDNPIIKPNRVEWFTNPDVSYALNIAPDDIRKVGNVYQLTLHGYTTDGWRAITLISNDLSEWHDVLSTPLSSPSSELMFTPNNMFIYIDNHNICLGVGVPNNEIYQDLASHKAESASQVGGVHGLIYEEGTWTPTLAGATIPGVQTYSRREGAYIRINNIVTVFFAITLTARDLSTTGTLAVTGLPFKPLGIGQNNGVSFGRISGTNIADPYTSIVAYAAGNPQFSLFKVGQNAFASLLIADIEDDFQILGSFTYKI